MTSSNNYWYFYYYYIYYRYRYRFINLFISLINYLFILLIIYLSSSFKKNEQWLKFILKNFISNLGNLFFLKYINKYININK